MATLAPSREGRRLRRPRSRPLRGLSDDGFAVVAGPLAGSEQHRLRALVIVNAEDEEQIRSRLAEDQGKLPKAEAILLTSPDGALARLAAAEDRKSVV